MLKIYIDNEEVIANQSFTIQKHMLNTPSVVLNNVCPKSWCENKDYTSLFYHPLDYSKCKIQDEEYHPEDLGTIVSSENASITITNADTNKNVELLELDGNTTQSGTPTPSSPVPINVVSGRQDIVVAGKNLFDGELELGFYNGSTGNKEANNSLYRSVNRISVQPNTTYTFSINGTTQKYVVLFYDMKGQYISQNTSLTTGTFTTLNNAYYITFRCFSADFTSDFANLKVQLEKGSTATTYEAYTGQTYEINLGKNLYYMNYADYTYNDFNGTDITSTHTGYSISGTSTSNTAFTLTNRYITLPAGTYTVSLKEASSMQIRLSKTNYSMITYIAIGSTSATFTLTEETNVCLTLVITNGTQYNETNEVMIEKGSIASSYAPYKTPIELCKINDYKDKIFRLEGKNLFDKDTMTLSNTFVNPTIGTANGFTSVYAPCKPNTTYTISKRQETTRFFVGTTETIPEVGMTATAISSSNTGTTKTITTGNNANYIIVMVRSSSDTLTEEQIINGVMIEQSSTATSYEPYGEKGTWYIEKNIGKVVLNGSETGWKLHGTLENLFYIDNFIDGYRVNSESGFMLSNYYIQKAYTSVSSLNNGDFCYSNITRLFFKNTSCSTPTDFQTWLSTHNTIVYYILNTPTYTQIEDSELLVQLNSLQLLEGLNNISITSGDLPGKITIHYNYKEEYTDIDLLFCGIVKNSGNISLNPREPHYTSLQILDFKDFLSSGETLDFVIYQKTILEAINQVIGTISDYGFVLGNVNILNQDDIIGAYSTKDKTAYDVFNYIADITQSRWTTRLIDENTVAIDFYDPTLMPQGTEIDYTNAFFNDKLIDDMKYSYGTNNYRNKQVMISNQVYSNISQAQTIVANGYQTQFPTEQPIGKINSITSNGTPLTFATFNEKDMGYVADFYYNPGDSYFESNDLRSTGEVLIIDYVAIVEGRQVITNATEIDRINESTGRKGIIARYETRNDATTSTELQKIGESYIKYKGTPEIKLTIQSRKSTWEVGQRVQFNAPIDELDTEYMVRSKKINYIYNQQDSSGTLFYTYELISSFNSETEINYFDNQRAKASGNIGEGEYISRNIDIESTANIIFYDTETTEVQVSGDNELNAILNSPFIS